MSAKTDTSADNSVDVAENLSAVQARIDGAAADAGRTPGSVTLVAVSKAHGPDRITAALAAGHRVFGENRVQEAGDKWPPLKDKVPDAVLHLIGGLQRNKAGAAVALFDVIETIDRSKLARAVAREMDRQGRRPQCFIQVNTGEEAQKGGIAPENADALIAECRDDLGLPLAGLMCIPPLGDEAALHYALLREMAARNGLDGLSMGMSGDFETAVRFGATHVRVGTAVFGARPPFKPAETASGPQG